jgi:hypothetical protein
MHYTFIAITIYVLILQFLKLIYLFFKPKFLSEKRFGSPKSKLMISAYYLIAICFILEILLRKLGYTFF